MRGFQSFSKVLRGLQRFREVFERVSEIFERFSEVLSETFQRQISSQRLSVLLPLILLPLELSPKALAVHFSRSTFRIFVFFAWGRGRGSPRRRRGGGFVENSRGVSQVFRGCRFTP